ncbi:MAG TPA: sigma-54 dependent transcriptional regulator [Pseudomonadota bacterium]|nr:sigma-54 dependent transcriptional regulator [Pseudomonadota bacterium]
MKNSSPPRSPRSRSKGTSSPPAMPPPVASLPAEPSEPASDGVFFGMWTADAGMQRVFQIVQKAAQSDVSVLLRGETGTGKELLAKALHDLSPRKGGPFHAISCAALPASLLESELFGHVRGSFTGAVRDNPGHFRLAAGGTLFLDEVAEMPLDVQAKLLRVLETHTVIPVGGRESIRVDVRIVAATHKALRAEVEAGHFRADLMYRLRVVPIFIPALRERGGDVIRLAQRFIRELNGRSSRRIERIATAAARRLTEHDWPGNVRELRNVIEYAFVIGEGPVLGLADLPPELHEARPSRGARALPPPPDPREGQVVRIRQALEQTGGHPGDAAQLLGISRVTLWRQIQRLGLQAYLRRSR